MSLFDEIRPQMRIALHAFDGMSPFHLTAPLLAFGEADRQFPDAGWSTVVWTETGEPVSTEDGLRVSHVRGPEATADADLLVIPTWPTALPAPTQALTDVIAGAHAAGAAVAGLCLGAFPVAASGILDGRTAVTHWAAAADLAHRHPGVEVDEDALYIDHGDVLTSAGTASALDACIHLIRRSLGAEAAARIARHLVIAPHREGGQAQYIERPLPAPDDGPLSRTLTWALANLDRELTVAVLSAAAHMSPRTFTRRFRELTGATPAAWVQSQRLSEACRLLETSAWSIECIARACGFGSPVTFRQAFAARYSTSPSSYRKRFSQA